ncbi:MAG: hypothetical protein ACYC26_03325 [Phycisphaerales bacterium]
MSVTYVLKGWKPALEAYKDTYTLESGYPQEQIAGNKRNWTYKGRLFVDNSSFDLEKHIAETGNNAYSFAATFSNGKNTDIIRMGFALRLSKETFAARKLFIDGKPHVPLEADQKALGAKAKSLVLQLEHGWLRFGGDLDLFIDFSTCQIVFLSNPNSGQVPQSRVSLDLRFLTDYSPDADLKNAADRAMTNDPPFGPDGQWFAYQGIDPDVIGGTPLDVSFLLHKPAGRYGRVCVKDGRFFFSNGREARFWGVNIMAEDIFPSHREAEYIARSLARMGANLVRLHGPDNTQPGLLFGKNPQNSTTMDPDQLGKLDYLLAQLKQNGIYLMIDFGAGREILPGDGIGYLAHKETLSIRAEFVPEIQEVQRRFQKEFLTHINPYTRMSLAEDPFLVAIEIRNEDSLFELGGPLATFQLKYAYEIKLWRQLYNEWLLGKYHTREALEKAWEPVVEGRVGLRADEDPAAGTVEPPLNIKGIFHSEKTKWMGDVIDEAPDTAHQQPLTNLSARRLQDCYAFAYDIQTQFYLAFNDFYRGLGYTGLVNGSSHWIEDLADLHANARLDLIDRHGYWAHPKGGWHVEKYHFDPASSLKSDSLITNFAIRSVFGKPYFIGEWNYGFPNQYIAEGPLLIGAYACLHNWSSAQFSAARAVDMRHPAARPIPSAFGLSTNALHLAIWPQIALMYHRKDVSEAKTGWYVRVSEAQAVDPFHMFSPYTDDLYNRDWEQTSRILGRVSLVAKTGLMFCDAATDKQYLNEDIHRAALADKDEYHSVTGQLTWNLKQGVLKIDTPGTQAVGGFTGGLSLDFSDMSATIETPFAVMILSSLTDEPIAASKKLLLTAVARMRNHGMKYNEAGDRVLEMGTLPIVLEPVVGRITLQGAPIQGIYALTPSGTRLSSVPFTSRDGATFFQLRTEFKTLHYEILR